VITGTVFFIVLSQKATLTTIVLGVLMSVVTYIFTRPVHFEKFPVLVLKLFYNVPKAVFESILVLIFHNGAKRAYEVAVKDEWEELEKTLTITLTPKTLVIVSEEGYMVVHQVGREKNEMVSCFSVNLERSSGALGEKPMGKTPGDFLAFDEGWCFDLRSFVSRSGTVSGKGRRGVLSARRWKWGHFVLLLSEEEQRMIYIGVVLMFLGTLLSLLKKDFLLKIHLIGISDTVGSLFIVLNFWEDVSRTILMVVLLLVWGPFVSHVIARMYTEGSS